MIVFSVIALLLIAAALYFVLPPLLGRASQPQAVAPAEINLSVFRDQLRELDAELAAGSIAPAQYESARRDLEKRVIEDTRADPEAMPQTKPISESRWPALAVALAVPLLALGLYLKLGTPAGLAPDAVDPSDAAAERATAHSISPQQIEAMVAKLEQRLQKQPDDAEGWTMLARSYSVLHRYRESGAAYRRAIRLQPGNAQLLADYADALAMANGRNLQGEPEQAIKDALKAGPDNLKALALAGTVEYERQNYKGAVEYWERILALVPPDSPVASSVADSVKEARQLAGMPNPPAQAAREQASGSTDAAFAATVSGTVELAPALKDKVAGNDTVFIFARAPGAKCGPPLAILRKTVKDLPIAFTLDDSMAMAPMFKLSSVPQVVVGARISRSGNAMPSPGDLEGYAQPVNVGASGVRLTIDRVIP
jgi:cytochrome c-type biogenesis protein CcmH